ncbi:MAG: phosphoribosylanthranilate isomerase [Planctomycetes bacterium]|nr:phosphoribosylanthranilate isomerase [Planctomycetota bacterium]
MTRVKICGITRPQDAVIAADAGADAIGLVFAKSPRQVTPSRAREIVAVLPPFVAAVGVFVNARPATIRRIVDVVGLTAVQLHGDESTAFIAQLGALRIIKALRVRDRSFVDDIARLRDLCVSGVLLDAYSPTARGGSGKRFDWDLVNQARQAGALDNAPPMILAGGLTPQNVRAAIRSVRPWAVDVSSGVESAPGIKSPNLIEQFVSATSKS